MLADLVQLVHFLLILFIIVIPFTPIHTVQNWLLYQTHFVTCISLITHWFTNSDVCFFTFLESKLRNIPLTESFMYKIIRPLYIITDKQIQQITFITTIILAFVSLYKLWRKRDLFYNSEIYKKLTTIIGRYTIAK